MSTKIPKKNPNEKMAKPDRYHPMKCLTSHKAIILLCVWTTLLILPQTEDEYNVPSKNESKSSNSRHPYQTYHRSSSIWAGTDQANANQQDTYQPPHMNLIHQKQRLNCLIYYITKKKNYAIHHHPHVKIRKRQLQPRKVNDSKISICDDQPMNDDTKNYWVSLEHSQNEKNENLATCNEHRKNCTQMDDMRDFWVSSKTLLDGIKFSYINSQSSLKTRYINATYQLHELMSVDFRYSIMHNTGYPILRNGYNIKVIKIPNVITRYIHLHDSISFKMCTIAVYKLLHSEKRSHTNHILSQRQDLKYMNNHSWYKNRSRTNPPRTQNFPYFLTSNENQYHTNTDNKVHLRTYKKIVDDSICCNVVHEVSYLFRNIMRYINWFYMIRTNFRRSLRKIITTSIINFQEDKNFIKDSLFEKKKASCSYLPEKKYEIIKKYFVEGKIRNFRKIKIKYRIENVENKNLPQLVLPYPSHSLTVKSSLQEHQHFNEYSCRQMPSTAYVIQIRTMKSNKNHGDLTTCSHIGKCQQNNSYVGRSLIKIENSYESYDYTTCNTTLKWIKDFEEQQVYEITWLKDYIYVNGPKICSIFIPQNHLLLKPTEIETSTTIIMPSNTRSRSRGRPKKSSKAKPPETLNKPILSNKVTPSNNVNKKLNISGHSVLKQKSLTKMWPTQAEAMEEAENNVRKAQENLTKIQDDGNADEDALFEAKNEVEDALDDQQATLDSYDYSKMDPEQRNLMLEVDAELAIPFEELKFNVPLPPSPSSDSNDYESSNSSSKSSYEGIEEITQEDTEAKQHEGDSTSTPPRSNSRGASTEKPRPSQISLVPAVPPQNELQDKVMESIKKVSPADKVKLMVSKARKRAQAQVKRSQSSNNEQAGKVKEPSRQQKISELLCATGTSSPNPGTKKVNTSKSKSTKTKKSSASKKPKVVKVNKKNTNHYEALASSDEEVENQAISDSEYEDDHSTSSESEVNEETSSQSSVSAKKSKAKKKLNSGKKKVTQTDIRSNNRQHSTLLTLKLKVKKSKDSVKEMINKATLWLKTMQILDPTIILYEYHSSSKNSAIIHHKKIPKEIEKFKKYFSGANPQIGEGHVWCQLSLGHDEPMSNLKASMQGWSSENDTYVYVKRLQHKETVREYFLLWSTQKMDAEKLFEATLQASKKYTKSELVFAFVWAVIRRDKGYTSNESKGDKGKQYTRALHIEVPRETKEATYSILSKLFSSRSTTQILRRDLRMVPVLRKEVTGYDRKKITHLIEKQERYMSTLNTIECYDLGDIDYVHPKLQMTLREMVMDLKTLRMFDPNSNTIKVFTSIDDATWPQPCHVLTYPKYLQSEAQEYVASLPSFFVWCYGEEVLNMMNSGAIQKAIEAPWDPEEMRAITPQSMELDAIMKESTAVAPWVDHEEVEVIPNISQIANDFVFRHSTDADSISTFHTKKSNRSSDDENDGTRHSKRVKMTSNILNHSHTDTQATSSQAGDGNDSISDGNSSREGVSIHAKVPPRHDSDLGAVL